MMDTAIGPLEEHLLEKRVIVAKEDAYVRTVDTQYWFNGQMVRNDLDIQLKQGLGMGLIQGDLGG